MLTADRLRKLLTYTPETGELRRRVTVSPRYVAGSLAGSVSAVSGYREVWVAGRAYYAHRLAWLHVHGHWPKGEIDHINGKRDDNRLCNLRDVGKRVNGENRWKANRNSQTGLLGVHYVAKLKKYRAEIVVAGTPKYLGCYQTAQEAHRAYLAAKRKHHEVRR